MRQERIRHNWRQQALADQLGLALLLIRRGNDVEAEPLLQRALAIREEWFGKEDPETIAIAEHYSALLRRLHQEEAIKERV